MALRLGTCKERCAGQTQPSLLTQVADLALLTWEPYMDLHRSHHQPVHELRAIALTMQEHVHGNQLGRWLGHSWQLSVKSKWRKKTWQNVWFSFIKSPHMDLQVTDPSMWRRLLPHSLRMTIATTRWGRNNTLAFPSHLLK